MASSSEYPVSLGNGSMLALQARKRLAATFAQELALLQLFDDIEENRG
jgi:hypothetical protein